MIVSFNVKFAQDGTPRSALKKEMMPDSTKNILLLICYFPPISCILSCVNR